MSQPEAIDAAAIAIAGLTPPTQHSQLCPVWTKPKKATASECNCWILHNATQAARAAIAFAAPILAKATRQQIAREIEAARTDRRDAADDAFLTWRDGMEEAAAIARGDSGERSN